MKKILISLLICVFASVTLAGTATVVENAAWYKEGVTTPEEQLLSDVAETVNEIIDGTSTLPASTIAGVAIAPSTVTATGAITGSGGLGLVVTTQDFVYTNFTDVTTTGTLDLDDLNAAGTIILGWEVTTTVGFVGDTSATIQVGIAGDLDRFSADTAGSVFGAATVGSAPLAATMFDGIGAITTNRVTVTAGSDFTAVSNAVGTITIYKIVTP